MPANIDTARDEIQALVNEAWEAGAATIAGTDEPPVLHWEGVPVVGAPPAEETHAKVFVRHTQAGQASLANQAGVRKWERLGIITVQIFATLQAGLGVTIAVALGELVRNALEGQDTPGGVWFRNVRVNEIGAERAFYHVNVVGEFEYHEHR